MTPQVSTSMNCSPTLMAVRSVFHQQRIGSDWTSPGRAALGGVIAGVVCTAGAGLVPGGVWALASDGIPHAIAPTTIPSLHNMVMLPSTPNFQLLTSNF